MLSVPPVLVPVLTMVRWRISVLILRAVTVADEL
jgi:hypothetical protein